MEDFFLCLVINPLIQLSVSYTVCCLLPLKFTCMFLSFLGALIWHGSTGHDVEAAPGGGDPP
jgi:hypothetical protein